MISFGVGAFLAAAFLDILPEAISMSPDINRVMVAALAGFVSFFVFERFLMKYFLGLHTNKEHADHRETLSTLLISGDTLHNAIDGIVIGLAFAANPAMGLPTALAIAAHEIPQEIGDFSILMELGWKKSRILAINILQSLLAVPGALVGFYIGQNIQVYLPIMLGVTAGVFLYVAASDLIPEIHHQSGHKYFYRVVIPMVISIFLVYFLILFSEHNLV